MALSMTEYRCKLIDKILFARSEDEVRRFIEAAIKGLKEHKVNGHLVARFVEKACQDLSGFNPITPDSRQSINIAVAAKIFNQLKQAILENEREPYEK